MTTINTSINIAGITFKNPIMPASGTFGSGQEYSEFVDLHQLGAVVTKGVSLTPWEGNPAPRIMETETVVDMLEINISCPNVEHGGIAFGQEPKMVEYITSEIKKIAQKPISMKLTPNVTDITEIAKAVEAGGADSISLINTITGMRIDVQKRKFCVANKTGGLSGSAIKPIALRMVYQVCHAVKIPVIGMGGIATINDVLEFIMAGATGIAIGTANFNNPFAMPEIISELSKYMEENNIETLDEIRGIVG